MHRRAMSILLVVMCAAITLAWQPAHAQESNNRATVETLYIPQISPASGNPDHEWEDIGPAMELGEALDKTAAWHRKFPDSLRLTREFEVERRNVPRAARQEKTDDKLPDLISTVRPGSPTFSKDKKANESSAKPLAGQTVTGTIGNYKVEIEFKGAGEKGTFSVTGQMKGKGEWKQLGKFLMMETDYAKYDGVIEEDSRVSGTRTVKETGERVKWSGWIKKGPEAVEGRNPAKSTESKPKHALDGSAFVGTWESIPDGTFGTVYLYTVRPNGTAKIVNTATGSVDADGPWSYNDNSNSIWIEKKSGKSSSPMSIDQNGNVYAGVGGVGPKLKRK